MARKAKTADASSAAAETPANVPAGENQNSPEHNHYASGAEHGADDENTPAGSGDDTGDENTGSRGGAEGAEQNTGDGEKMPGEAKPEDALTPVPVERELRATRRHLRVIYTDAQKLEFAHKMAEAQKHYESVEDEKKRANTQFKSRLEIAAAERDEMMDRIQSGYEMREIECTVTANKPSAGLKTVTRTDTGETVAIEPMTLDERQMELPLGDKTKDEPKPTIPHRQTRGGVVACAADGETLNDHADKEDY